MGRETLEPQELAEPEDLEPRARRRGLSTCVALSAAVLGVPVHRGSALLAAHSSVNRLRTFAEDFDLAGVDELLELRVLDGLRGDVSGLSGSK